MTTRRCAAVETPLVFITAFVNERIRPEGYKPTYRFYTDRAKRK
jgi:hypothetical protein